MNRSKRFFKTDKAGFLVSNALLLALAGCVGYVSPRQGGAYVAPPPMDVTVVAQDDYVYYPSYQVYYSSSRREYAYPENGGWVSRPAPRGITVSVLQASPSVRMNFHDAPANHHAEVVQRYPKNWTPPKANQGRKANDQDDQRDENRGR